LGEIIKDPCFFWDIRKDLEKSSAIASYSLASSSSLSFLTEIPLNSLNESSSGISLNSNGSSLSSSSTIPASVSALSSSLSSPLSTSLSSAIPLNSLNGSCDDDPPLVTLQHFIPYTYDIRALTFDGTKCVVASKNDKVSIFDIRHLNSEQPKEYSLEFQKEHRYKWDLSKIGARSLEISDGYLVVGSRQGNLLIGDFGRKKSIDDSLESIVGNISEGVQQGVQQMMNFFENLKF